MRSQAVGAKLNVAVLPSSARQRPSTIKVCLNGGSSVDMPRDKMKYLLAKYPNVVCERAAAAKIRRFLIQSDQIALLISPMQFQLLQNYDVLETDCFCETTLFENIDLDHLKDLNLLEEIEALFIFMGVRPLRFYDKAMNQIWFESIEEVEEIIARYQLTVLHCAGSAMGKEPEIVKQAKATLMMTELYGSKEKAGAVLKACKDIHRRRVLFEREKKALSTRVFSGIGTNESYESQIAASKKRFDDACKEYEDLLQQLVPSRAVKYFLERLDEDLDCRVSIIVKVYVVRHCSILFEFLELRPVSMSSYSPKVLDALLSDALLLYYGFEYDISALDYVSKSQAGFEGSVKARLFSCVNFELVASPFELEHTLRDFLVKKAGVLPEQLPESRYFKEEGAVRPNERIMRKVKCLVDLEDYEAYLLEQYALEKNRVEVSGIVQSVNFSSYIQNIPTFKVVVRLSMLQNPRCFLVTVDTKTFELNTLTGATLKSVLSKLERFQNETPPVGDQVDYRRADVLNLLGRVKAKIGTEPQIPLVIAGYSDI